MSEYEDVQEGTARQEALAALPAAVKVLSPLSLSAQRYLVESLGTIVGVSAAGGRAVEAMEESAAEEEGGSKPAREFQTFADLFHAAGAPKTAPQKALLASFWLQECQGNESFKSFAIGQELKALGHGVAHVTNALSSLSNRKPALVYRVGRIGSGKRAQKLHKLSDSGIRAVELMLAENA